MSRLHFVNLSLNSHYWGPFLSLKLIHAVLLITLWLQDVLMALSLSLLVLVRESLVSLLGLFWCLVVRGVRVIFNTVFLIWPWIIFFLLWLSRYCPVASVEKLAAEDLIEAELRSHRYCTIFLNSLFYLSLINSLHNASVLVLFSFMASYDVPAPSPQSDAKYAGAHAESNKAKDAANDSSFDLVFSCGNGIIFIGLID